MEIRHLRKAFGALIATDDVSLSIRTGETHALIGPNGAGKTTLVGQLTGELEPDAGRISFRGHDITGLSTARRARLGLARSFQITSIFDSFIGGGQRRAGGAGDRAAQLPVLARAERIPRLRRPARRAASTRSGLGGTADNSSRRGCRTASIASSSSEWRSPPIR